MSTPGSRNLAAEVRAVEEGHQARLDDGDVVVVSDTTTGKTYRVSTQAFGDLDLVTFRCRPEGAGAYTDDHLATAPRAGEVGCKHGALAARRLAREGRVTLDGDGQWVATTALGVAADLPANPLDGLPT